MIISDDWDHFYFMSEHYVIGAGTHAIMASALYPEELSYGENKEINSGRGWYRSQEKVAGKYPYAGYLTNKKWHLNEVDVFANFNTYKHQDATQGYHAPNQRT